MAKKITIHPVTRIEGHLTIEVEVENGKVKNAWSSGTMARGLDAAFGAKVPWAGNLIRNLVMGAEYIYDHVLHFYQLSALDYIDIMAIANYKGKDKELLAVKDKIVGLVKAKDTYPLTPRYEPDDFTVKDPDIVISAVSHYLKALKMHAKARNMGAIWGERNPHYQNIVVGGVTSYPDLNQWARFRTMLDEQKKFIEEVYIPDVLAFGTGPLGQLPKR